MAATNVLCDQTHAVQVIIERHVNILNRLQRLLAIAVHVQREIRIDATHDWMLPSKQ